MRTAPLPPPEYDRLTLRQKLHALGHRFYQMQQWTPALGDYYTTARPDMELYRIAAIDEEEGLLFTEYTTAPGALTSWPIDGFTTEGFGPCRVHVPLFFLESTVLRDDA